MTNSTHLTLVLREAAGLVLYPSDFRGDTDIPVVSIHACLSAQTPEEVSGNYAPL